MWMFGLIMLLVWPLMLAPSPIGESCTEDLLFQDNERCCKECPAGYHKREHCAGNTYKCKECANGSFTSIPNSVDECERCRSCNYDPLSVVVSNCSKNQNSVCGCKREYYSTSKDESQLHCINCSLCKNCSVCPTCEVCLSCHKSKDQIENNGGRKECLKYPQATLTTSRSTTTSLDLKTTTFGSANLPDIQHYTIFVLAAFIVLSFLCILGGGLLRREGGQGWCFKPAANLKFSARNPHINDQLCHQSSNPTSQVFNTLNVCEGIPVVYSCQYAGTQHPTHFPPLLPDPQLEVFRQEAHLESWPAIVLYAIIKEVPLRRWKEFLRRLSVAETQLERVEFETNPALGFLERQYQMLRLWSQSPTATLEDVYSALDYMDLTGCVQQLQDNLDKLQLSTNIGRAVAIPVTSMQHDRTAEAQNGHLNK